jgi:cytidylate kinase
VQRDARDSGRTVAPLQKSADAQLLDTTTLSIEESVEQVLKWSEAALRRPHPSDSRA